MSFNEELKKWRKERDITVKSQKPGLVGNLLEEITEIARAKNLDDVVDGILDYSVYLANAIEEVSLDQELLPEELEEINNKKTKYKDLDEKALTIYKNYFVFRLMDGVKSRDLLEVSKEHEEQMETEIKIHLGFLNSLFRLIKSAVIIAGYDFDKAFNEVFKAIHSRKGKWSHTLNKFEKDKEQTDRYEPNYENAKIR